MNRITQSLILIIVFNFIGGFCFARSAPLTIQSVSIKPESKDNALFTVLIDLHVNQKNIPRWALGFYMPRTYRQLVDSENKIAINPDLILTLCDKTNTCIPVHYIKDHAKYVSSGLISLFAPNSTEFALQAGQDYRLVLEHSNQHAPTGLTGVPQSFFLIEQDKFITPLPEVPAEYYHLNMDSNIPVLIQQRSQWKWENSIQRDPNNLSDALHLVPTPHKIIALKGSGFSLNRHKISVMDAFTQDTNPRFLAQYLRHDKSITLSPSSQGMADIDIIKISLPHPEGYRLTIANHKIILAASTTTGVFYGLQTLRQLWNQTNKLPAVIIEDYPRFRYRGILLDVARHYVEVKDIKQFLDLMASQKLNTLHLHLADDEGWRIDLADNNNDPLTALTNIGSRRGYVPGVTLPPTLLQQANLDLANHAGFTPEGALQLPHYASATTLYSGHYSADDIQSLIHFANARHITIIPEIDLPGHARALKLSLPQVFNNPDDHSQYSSVNIYFDNVLPICFYKANTKRGKLFTQTIDRILSHLDTLFSQQHTIYFKREISLAGDEVSSSAWTDDTSCHAPWTTLSALDKSQLFFTALHRNIPNTAFSGWQQLVQTDEGHIGHYALSPNDTAHLYIWERAHDKTGAPKGIQDAANLANAGYPTVLAFADDTYFDLTYTPDPWEPGSRWAGSFVDTYAALHSALDATLAEQQLTPNNKHNLLGLEGAIWSESMLTRRHLAYMTLPKMTGLAEAAWASSTTTSQNDKINWQSLAYRLGDDNRGFLGYLARIHSLTYRGYPHGITGERHANE